MAFKQMNAERRKLLKQAFVDADADGNGKMDFEEFSALLGLIDPGYAVDVADCFFFCRNATGHFTRPVHAY